MTNKKSLLFWGMTLCCLWGNVSDAMAYSISPNAIYRQAQLNNLEYFRLLSRYRNVINITDKQGNTAYCLAANNNDKQAMELLVNYGADTSRPCYKVKVKENKTAEKSSTRSPKFRQSNSTFESDNSYYWAAAGVLAAGAGIAALASGGGGSGSDSGSGSGNSHVDVTLPSGELVNVDPQEFRTEEYLRTNFLDGINAAEVYSRMYKKDQSGTLFSHQANSDAALKKIKVGVLDSGVFANSDLAGKVVSSIDSNPYNNAGNVWGVSRDGWGQAYIMKKENKYYLFKISDKFTYMVREDGKVGLSEAEMQHVLGNVWKIPFNEFTLINAGGGSAPGVDTSTLVTDLSLGESILVDNWQSIATGLNHGTHVTGIIAANKNDIGSHGVAFDNAEIVAASWDLNTNTYGTVKSMVDSGATVLNNSWGVSVSDGISAATAREILPINNAEDLRAYAYAANKGAVWVQATGNDAAREAGLHAGMGRMDLSKYGYSGPKAYEVPYVAVTSLDYDTRAYNAPSGKLASYSNWCGFAANYCLAAPGTSVDSTAAMKNGVVDISGTSMATPVVSGSIALLNGYYPWLSSQNIAYLLLETANDQGEYANSQKYGRGALDLLAAITTPIGGLGLPTQTSFNSMVPVTGSRLALSSTLQNRLAKVLPEQITAFDALNRPFQYDVKNMVNTTHASNANLRHTVSRLAQGQPKKVVKDEQSGFSFTTENSLDRGGNSALSLAEVTTGGSENTARFFYAANSKYMTVDDALVPSSNPYLAMNEAYGAENTLKLSNTAKLKFSLQTGENGLYERDYETDKHSFDDRAYALNGEYSFNMTDYLEIAALGGMLFEDNALLGMNGTGALGIKDSSTYYMGVRAALNLTPNTTLLAAYYRGFTQGADAAMLSVSDLETESFMLAGEYKLNKKSKVGVSLSSPLSVVKGKASFMYANGRDSASDTIYMQKLTSSLRPEAKEYDVGLYYQGNTEDDLNFTGKVSARFNADGEKGLTDYIGVVGVSAAF